MKRKPVQSKREPTEAEIQHAAYLLWLENGRPEGHDVDHWFAAKEALRHREGHTPHFRHAPARHAELVPSA